MKLLLALTIIAAATPLAAQAPDTATVKVIRGPTAAPKPDTFTIVLPNLTGKKDSSITKVARLTRADSLAIFAVARAFVDRAADTTATIRLTVRGDTVFVHTWLDPSHVSFTSVRVVRRDARWFAVSSEGFGIR